MAELDGHRIDIEANGDTTVLNCECGWAHSVTMTEDTVVPGLRELADAGRDHIVDVLGIAAPPQEDQWDYPSTPVNDTPPL